MSTSRTPRPPRRRDAVSNNGSTSPEARAGTRGVLLINLGTPEQPDTPSVRRYLTEFLADPEVIQLPRALRWMNYPLARLIAQFRASSSAELYRNVWTDRGSPLKVITSDQADALEDMLPNGWRVFYAMRYGAPSIEETLERIVASGIEDLVVIPMYPQFSGPTTGTALAVLYEKLARYGRQLNVKLRTVWHDDAGYVDAQARLLHEYATEHRLDPSNCVLLFSTHSMPASYIERGDPYQEHVLRTVDLVMRRLGWDPDRAQVSYQSKLGPVPWLEPSTQETLQKLAAAGENVLVCPVSFTADCLETLEELGITYREEFEADGARMHLCPALNTYEPFIKTLFHLVLRGARPIDESRPAPAPLMPRVREPEVVDAQGIDLDSLIMVGVSLPPRLGDGNGPSLHHVSPTEFQQIKKPREQVAEILRTLGASDDFSECWLWNTCSRFEFYGWLRSPRVSAETDQVLARTVRNVVGPGADRVDVNVLEGADAWHHVMRTAGGLNGGLPGDAEVAEQLRAACRVAHQCGTDGPKTQRLIDIAIAADSELRTHTKWGRFRSAYCPVAIRSASLSTDTDWERAQCAVIGGSVTARSILLGLRAQFGVPDGHLTAVYRTQSRGRQIKRLRAALGDGRVVQVEDYREQDVRSVIAEADVIFWGTDSPVKMLDAEALKGLRDFAQRPLDIFDFNTLGSTTTDVTSIPGVRLYDAQWLEDQVRRFASTLCQCPAFRGAHADAEAWLHRRLEVGVDGACPAADDRSTPWPEGCVCTNGSSLVGAACSCADAGPSVCPQTLIAERNVQ
ncbi:MAG: ferrochelatase [Planctomycetes bacterium]|nr:ferrochelatase [Planctomycetota bacterium]